MSSLPLHQTVQTVDASSLRRCLGCLWIVPIVLLFICGDARAQESVDFATELEAAYERGEHAELIAENRLRVKPVVHALITESLEAELAGDRDAAAAKKEAAETIAAAFEEQFGEKSLREAVSYLDGWSASEKRLKLRADSLHDVATEQRAGADTREAALENYMAAIENYRRIGDRVGEATTLGGIGFVYWYLGNADSTLAYIEAGLEARRAVDDRELVGNSLNDMGSASRVFIRDNAAAIDYYHQAAAVREEIGDDDGLARTLSFLGVVYQSTGAIRTAVGYLDRSAELAQKIGDRPRAFASLAQAGAALTDLGEHSEALARLERALEMTEPGDVQRANVQSQIGIIYQQLGDYEAALQKYEDVIAIAEAAPDSMTLAAGVSNAGIVLHWAERYPQAARYFERALAIYDDLGDATGRLNPLINLASVYQDLEEYDRSEPLAREALALSRELEDPLREARSLILLGNLYNLTARGDRGKSYYEEGLAIAREIGNPELEWAALMGFGERLERQGRYEKAVTYYRQALEKIESVRSGLHFRDDKAKFLAQKRFVYENVVHVLSLLHEDDPTEGHARTAFEVAERGKARAFLDLLGEAAVREVDRVDPTLRQREQELLAAIGEAQAAVQVASSESSDDAATLRDRLDELEEEYQSLQREIQRTSPAYSEISNPKIASLEEVQEQLLDDHTVLLQYSVGDSSSTLWAVTAEAVTMHRLPPQDVLSGKVEALRFALTQPDRIGVDDYAVSARTLYRDLIMPAEDFLSDAAQVIIVPDDVLHYVPFEALLTKDVDAATFADLPYLARTHATSYGHSASVLLQLLNPGDDGRHEKQLLAFGDPDFGARADPESMAAPVAQVRAGLSRLPYSGAEVTAIADQFAEAASDVYVRAEADERKLKEAGLLERYRYLHFATHGIVDERRPDFSGVVLAQNQDGGEDGYLQAAEIFNLNIAADLVVLSACETGLGEMVRGEGLVGLTRAFMYAGAPAIVVSLWKVSDASTATLMSQFYGSMIEKGLGTSEALRAAKLEMIADEAHAHPFHWAPFVIIGKRN